AKLINQFFDRRGFEYSRGVETRRIFLGGPGARPRTGRGLHALDAPQDLVTRDPEDVISQIDINGRGPLGHDLADNALSVLEHYGFKFAGLEHRGCQIHETRRRNEPKKARCQEPLSLNLRSFTVEHWTKLHCKNHFDPFNPTCLRLRPNSHDTICL